VRDELGRRRKKRDECYSEYRYKVLDIASKVKIEVEALIGHIIQT